MINSYSRAKKGVIGIPKRDLLSGRHKGTFQTFDVASKCVRKYSNEFSRLTWQSTFSCSSSNLWFQQIQQTRSNTPGFFGLAREIESSSGRGKAAQNLHKIRTLKTLTRRKYFSSKTKIPCENWIPITREASKTNSINKLMNISRNNNRETCTSITIRTVRNEMDDCPCRLKMIHFTFRSWKKRNAVKSKECAGFVRGYHYSSIIWHKKKEEKEWNSKT